MREDRLCRLSSLHRLGYYAAVGNDRTGAERRTTVAEAAELLGISAEAIRGRIRRGTLPVDRQGGRVYVVLEQASEWRTTGDRTRTTTDRPGDRTEQLIATLQQQLEAEREAHGEARRIIAGLVGRVPAIEAATDVRGSPVPGTEREAGTPVPKQEQQAQTAMSPRSWWRRVFGG